MGHLLVSDNDAIRVITLQRPEKKNAITRDMYRAMSGAIDSAQNDPVIRCIVITGNSGVFTAGNDLDDFLKDGTSGGGDERASDAVKFLYSLLQNTKPLIAAVANAIYDATGVRLRRVPFRDARVLAALKSAGV